MRASSFAASYSLFATVSDSAFALVAVSPRRRRPRARQALSRVRLKPSRLPRARPRRRTLPPRRSATRQRHYQPNPKNQPRNPHSVHASIDAHFLRPAITKRLSVNPLPRRKIESMALLVYTAPGCRDCREAKRFLADHSIPYTEIDIPTPTPGAADELVAHTGNSAIPPVRPRRPLDSALSSRPRLPPQRNVRPLPRIVFCLSYRSAA